MNQANSTSDPSQILILQFPIPGAFLPPPTSLSNFTQANWNCFLTLFLILITFFIGCHILSYPIRLHATTSIRYIKSYAKLRQWDVLLSYIEIIISCGSNILPSKNWVLFSFTIRQHGQKRLYLQYKVCWTTRSTTTLSSIQSMLYNTVNNNSIFSTTFAAQHGQQ